MHFPEHWYLEVNNCRDDTAYLIDNTFLIFRFYLLLKKWANLNNIRNAKAGHGGANGYVTSANIEELLEIIELILT